MAIDVFCTSFKQEEVVSNVTTDIEMEEEIIVSELLADMVNEVAEENFCFEVQLVDWLFFWVIIHLGILFYIYNIVNLKTSIFYPGIII